MIPFAQPSFRTPEPQAPASDFVGENISEPRPAVSAVGSGMPFGSRMPFGSAFGPLLALLLIPVLAERAQAHAFHVTVAEAEVNHKTRCIEMALRVHPGDLELALGRIAKRRIRLEKEPKVDRLIRDYLQRSIELKTAKHKPARIKWIGKDVSIKWAWLYFEIPLEHGLDQTTLTNQVFFELLPDQVNTVILRDKTRRQTLTFRRDKAVQTIRLSEPTAVNVPDNVTEAP